ncbi:hydrophobe/amphiphile efflux-1 family RND transporter [Acuticoccus sediminis]|uniref:Efflux pump membrane transporter n=1 Tax=Acuticoccus sediminis TaxID=2184697 RepID=A0A8B2NWK2_9HYPH|nr:efflux RND transporter permease subunit [Acuticoccus sediminis]RAI03221.1 hydrophobe/amphiphile efflux-1 family RND transporter [Acuticoccus sediminis]
MGQFFVGRPVFAWVIAIVTMLAGAFALTSLPVSQYPEIAPTTVRISATYPGATASAVENSVTREIEDRLTGLDGLLYMVSNSREGSSSITLTFDDSVSGSEAENDVQTLVRQAESQLPDAVQQQGVNVSRSTSSILMVGALVATDGDYTTAALGNIVETTVENEILRTEGVGDLNVFGSGYAMRIWLKPLALARYQLTPTDVVQAVQAQNTTVSVGSLGSQPTTRGQQFTATVTAQSQLTGVAEFEAILLKSDEGGGAVYLADVADIEIGQEDYGGSSRFNGLPAAGFGVNLATGANATDTAARVRATMDRLESTLPTGVEFRVAYDTSPFVERSINQVYHTLIEAVVLVVLVLVVFLQSWRATLIPLIAVPVVLLGTFAVLSVAGYSINTLTMFAMVLAIGLLVDDAIVVVENVERLMREKGLSPVEATRQSMGEIASALIGIAVVLSAVFLPMAFFGGSTGVIYRQFSLTMVTAMVLSLLVAIILTPAMCASILRKKNGREILPARLFNRGFDAAAEGYAGLVRRTAGRPFLALLVLAGILLGAYTIFERMTSSFLPTEDQGMLMAMVTLPEGATTQQTAAVVSKVEETLLADDAVQSAFASLGFSFGGSGQNRAMLFVSLKDFDERSGSDMAASAVALRANKALAGIRSGQVFVMQPPAVPGLGNMGGFSMYLVDQSGAGSESLTAAAESLVEAARGDQRLQNVRTDGTNEESALRLIIDQRKAESFGLTLSDINAMLTTIFASSNVNDFLLGASLRPVIVQGAARFRMQPEDIDEWYARNADGEMVPFSAFMTTKWEPVAPSLTRFDGSSAIEIQGDAGPGASSGVAMEAMEELVADLPGGYGAAWTGLSYQERQSGSQAPLLYAMSALVVFLSLAALYESWSIPFAVMLGVPVGILGALAAAWLMGQNNDVYFKVGMLTTIGLAARNAILIVEFAEHLRAEGEELLDAAVRAARLRLRPIMMTALTFILGVAPLAVATGAGAAAQNAIGIGVIGGMIASTFIGIFMVPAAYVMVRRLTALWTRRPAEEPV